MNLDVVRAPTQVFMEQVDSDETVIALPETSSRRRIVMTIFGAPFGSAYWVAFGVGETTPGFKFTGTQIVEVPPYCTSITVTVATTNQFFYYFA